MQVDVHRADGSSIQRSAQAGGTLEVQVYAGRDGEFEMVEDDGISLDYQSEGQDATRTTTWRWSDTTKTLTWAVQAGQNASG